MATAIKAAPALAIQRLSALKADNREHFDAARSLFLGRTGTLHRLVNHATCFGRAYPVFRAYSFQVYIFYATGAAIARVSDNNLVAKRARTSRAALEMAITNAVRSSNPQCNGFVGTIVEFIMPMSSAEANWTVKGIGYGKVERSRCDAAVAAILKPLQLEFDISD